MSRRFDDMVSAEIARQSGSSRALVVSPPPLGVDPLDHFSGLRASFLAHLIAMRDRVPQTLNLRRASPVEAVSSYTHHPDMRSKAHSHTA